jgi:phosphoglucomutase/phosphomannomutase
VFCQEEVDHAFIGAVVAQAITGPRDLKVIYSPLHGVGASAVLPALKEDGFEDVELFAPQAEPNGDFPNVPGHVSNPENPAVFDALIERAKEVGADLCVASDPDCDRIGLAAPLTPGSDEWKTMTGNQIGALLTEYVLEGWKSAGKLSAEHYVAKTLVTTDMIARICESYGARCYGNLLVGFKWIGGLMDEKGPEKFVFGTEESHGYLAGTHVRDKDGAVGAMLAAELAARVKADGKTPHEKLDDLYWQYGCHAERMVSVTMPGAEGMDRMKALMANFRSNPPETLAGIQVAAVRDYLSQTVTPRGGAPKPLEGPRGDMVIIDLASPGTYVAVRPSGTEPKVKFYMFTSEPPEQLHDLEETKRQLAERLDALAGDLRDFAGA